MAWNSEERFAGQPAGLLEAVAEIVVEQVEEALVTVLETLRERPLLTAAVGASVASALVGLVLASRRQPRRPKVMNLVNDVLADLEPLGGKGKVGKKVRRGGSRGLEGLGSAAELLPLALQLLQNSIVRAYVRGFVRSQLRRRFG